MKEEKVTSKNKMRFGFKRQTKVDSVIDIVNFTLLLLFTVAILIPFLVEFLISVCPPEIWVQRNITLGQIFENMTFKYYAMTMAPGSHIYKAFGVSIFRVIVGGGLAMLVTVLTAYPLSKRYLPGGKPIMYLFYFTMLFSGGMIPTFLVVRGLGLIDSIWSLILPCALNVYYLIIMRTFFKSIPAEIEESARIDGCNDYGILFRIVLPLSIPAIAAIGLFYTVGYWNSFLDAVLYITNRDLWPVQLLLRESLMADLMSELSTSAYGESAQSISMSSMKAAMVMVTAIPVIILYPFVQRHFAAGIMVGSLKG